MPLEERGEPQAALETALTLRQHWLECLRAGQASPADDPWPAGPVVRVYDGKTLIDLRTGLIGELSMQMLAALPVPAELVDREVLS